MSGISSREGATRVILDVKRKKEENQTQRKEESTKPSVHSSVKY